jgi:hypothetical protein
MTRTTDEILESRRTPKTDAELAEIGQQIEALYADSYSEINSLNALIDELRERLPGINEAQSAHVGNYMLRALWLGQGKDLELVFSHTRPPLTVVADPGESGRVMARLIHGDDVIIRQRTRPTAVK